MRWVARSVNPKPPVRFSKTPASQKSHAPMPGEHTVEILRDLGYDDARIEFLKSNGAAD